MAIHTDVAIIGSGPAGYTAALYAARADLRPIVFEGALAPGGSLMTTSEVENFPGFPDGITGPDLMSRMRAQAERFGARLTPADIVEVDLAGDVKLLRTEDGEEYGARAVILAMGSEYRRLGLPSETRLAARGVSWCATCDAPFFRDKRVAVVGGGDSALEEATYLAKFARSVTILHRRREFRASKVMVQRLQSHPSIDVRWNAEVEDFLGVDTVEGVVVRDVQDGSLSTLPIDGAFVAIGHSPRSELVAGTVGLTSTGHVAVAAGTSRTDVEGVFACGDLVDARYRQAVTAAGSGCQAALDVEAYLAHSTAPSGSILEGMAA
jgi:thioredoxin reductase (NADPH)